MARISTVLIVGALMALGTAALLSALQGDESADSPGRQRAPKTADEREALTARLEQEGVFGVLYFTDQDCQLRALTLPRLELASAPAWRRCHFSVSPAGAVAGDEAVWHPQGPLGATERSGTIEAFAPGGAVQFTIRGSLPAFKPDGSLTFVDDRGIVALRTDCPTRAARCRDTLLSREALAKQLGKGSLRKIAWLDDDSFAAIVGHERFRNEVIAVFTGNTVINAPLGFADRRLTELVASPRGALFVVLTERFGPWVFDRHGKLVASEVVPGAGRRARKLAWSPDGRWLAIATPASVYLVNSDQLPLVRAGRQPETIRISLSARDIAWR